MLHYGLPSRHFGSFCTHRHDDVLSGRQRMFVPGCFPCSSLSPAKHSPSNFEPWKTPASGRFCRLGLGFFSRNDTRNLSLNGRLSPKLGGWPIYSTSFLSCANNVVANRPGREVRNPSAPAWAFQTYPHRPPAIANIKTDSAIWTTDPGPS
jgi:hypothetical protein